MSTPPYPSKVLAVKVQEGQYHIEGAIERLNPSPPSHDGLTTGEQTWMAVLTGTQWGPVTVHLQRLDHPPQQIDTGWKMVVERDIVNTGEGLEINSLFQGGAGAVFVPPGRYRIRLHVRDRAVAAPHNITETPLETHLIQLWPSSQPRPHALLVGPDENAAHR